MKQISLKIDKKVHDTIVFALQRLSLDFERQGASNVLFHNQDYKGETDPTTIKSIAEALLQGLEVTK